MSFSLEFETMNFWKEIGGNMLSGIGKKAERTSPKYIQPKNVEHKVQKFESMTVINDNIHTHQTAPEKDSGYCFKEVTGSDGEKDVVPSFCMNGDICRSKRAAMKECFQEGAPRPCFCPENQGISWQGKKQLIQLYAASLSSGNEQTRLVNGRQENKKNNRNSNRSSNGFPVRSLEQIESGKVFISKGNAMIPCKFNGSEHIFAPEDKHRTDKRVDLIVAAVSPTSKPSLKTEIPYSGGRSIKRRQAERKILTTRITRDLAERLEKNPKKLFIVFFAPPGPFAAIKDKTWKWEDSAFVRVPLSSEFNKKEDSLVANYEMDKHWDVIRMELEKLLEDITNSRLQLDIGDRLKQAIVAYCPDAEMKSDFEILYRADLNEPLQNTLHLIIRYALCLPNLLSSPIPVLAQGHSSTLFLTKRLTCSLLANAFLCTIPDPQDDMPDFNFLRFFSSSSDAKSDVKAEKLKCIINYFSEMSTLMEAAFTGGEGDDDIISFERRCIRQQRDWKSSDNTLIDVHIEAKKGIEQAENMLQVDFANKIIGGGVLNDGAVMEEIRFCICPELIVSRLFTAPLDDDEVLVITGTQQYSLYSGYSTTFQYRGSFGDQTEERDNLNRRFTQVVGMDALHFRQSEISKQFQEPSINRELHKCYVACIHSTKGNTPFATGNWGCGVFNGDPEMKFFIQWLSASEAGRQSLYYHTIGDKEQGKSIEAIVRYIKRKQLNVSSLYNLLLDYYEDWDDYDSVFDFVKDKLKSSSKPAKRSSRS